MYMCDRGWRELVISSVSVQCEFGECQMSMFVSPRIQSAFSMGPIPIQMVWPEFDLSLLEIVRESVTSMDVNSS